MVFPGPDAHVEHGAPQHADAPSAVASTWRVQVTLSHEGPETTAQAMLVTGTPEHLGAVGHAIRNPQDDAVPVIGEEVAVARALRRLADRLLDTAEEQIEDSTGLPARLHV